MKNLLLAVLFTAGTAGAQTLQSSAYIHSGVYSKHFTDAFSFCSNTAALAGISQLSAAVLAEQKFLLNELKQYTAAVSFPVQKDGIGIMAAWRGVNYFNTSQFGLAYGKQLGKVSMGVQFNYQHTRIAGYGSGAAIAIDVGSIWQLSKKLYTAIQLSNVAGGKYNKNNEEKLPSLYTVSIGYKSAEKLLISTTIIKEEDKPATICAGVQYIFDEKLYTRFYISTDTNSPFFSAGWKWKNCRADITASYHPQLGITPGILLQFFGKKKENGKEEL